MAIITITNNISIFVCRKNRGHIRERGTYFHILNMYSLKMQCYIPLLFCHEFHFPIKGKNKTTFSHFLSSLNMFSLYTSKN
jgi:hypothetical protein